MRASDKFPPYSHIAAIIIFQNSDSNQKTDCQCCGAILPGKVLVLLSELEARGGVQRFNKTLLAALRQLEIQTDVYCLNDARGCGKAFITSRIAVKGFERRKVLFIFRALREALFGNHDIVVVGHFHLLLLGSAVAHLRWRQRPRVLLVAHGTEVWRKVSGLSRILLGGVARILCVSRYTLESIRAQAPELSASSFSLFPNALGETWSDRVSLNTQNASAGSLPEKFILSVGRITKHDRTKGIFTVIEALQHIESSIHYLIVGPGDDFEYLEGLARQFQVSARVHFLGAVSDEVLRELYGRSIAFVLPSSQEGFGIVFLEAMYFGAPVIAAREKGATDVVDHEQTGLLVRYADPREVACAVSRLVRESQTRERLVRNARANVTGGGRFTFAAFVQRCALELGLSDSVDTANLASRRQQAAVSRSTI